ncbi:unnamed protein product [Acanthoscelides obtectus]|uniref:Uncharacterized protein n=1 Tax=Acanthoscelides obtectus TaxID=200917 RepID=A0A9P0PBC1_ACAOB|nr:unnamed protein product [Acanthoscelides obtectus]CAK1640143.1 hypothetical protein AOBTE_LOCUS11559 [Acanthoscelides obtectus]
MTLLFSEAPASPGENWSFESDSLESPQASALLLKKYRDPAASWLALLLRCRTDRTAHRECGIWPRHPDAAQQLSISSERIDARSFQFAFQLFQFTAEVDSRRRNM